MQPKSGHLSSHRRNGTFCKPCCRPLLSIDVSDRNASWRHCADALTGSHASMCVMLVCRCTCRKPHKQSAEGLFLSIVAAIAIFAALAGLLALLLCKLLFPWHPCMAFQTRGGGLSVLMSLHMEYRMGTLVTHMDCRRA